MKKTQKRLVASHLNTTKNDPKDKVKRLLLVVIGVFLISVGLVIEILTDSPVSIIFYFVGGLTVGVGGVQAFGAGKKQIRS